jgi:hypothetical protein
VGRRGRGSKVGLRERAVEGLKKDFPARRDERYRRRNIGGGVLTACGAMSSLRQSERGATAKCQHPRSNSRHEDRRCVKKGQARE